MKSFYHYMKKNRFLVIVLAAVAVLVILILWVSLLEWAGEYITPVYQDYQNRKSDSVVDTSIPYKCFADTEN